MTPYDAPKPAGNPAAHSGFLRNTGRSKRPEVSPCLSRILRNARVALLPLLALQPHVHQRERQPTTIPRRPTYVQHTNLWSLCF